VYHLNLLHHIQFDHLKFPNVRGIADHDECCIVKQPPDHSMRLYPGGCMSAAK